MTLLGGGIEEYMKRTLALRCFVFFAFIQAFCFKQIFIITEDWSNGEVFTVSPGQTRLQITPNMQNRWGMIRL